MEYVKNPSPPPSESSHTRLHARRGRERAHARDDALDDAHRGEAASVRVDHGEVAYHLQGETGGLVIAGCGVLRGHVHGGHSDLEQADGAEEREA